MKNGNSVKAFESAFAEFVGAKYAIALCNGTATLHTALVALGVKPGDKVAVPPLTMSATTIAVLQAGAVPIFVDVYPDTWLMRHTRKDPKITVSLYGLHSDTHSPQTIDDAAQTLRPHDPRHRFTSYSFQASKILALGEGGCLVTNDEELATKARSFSSLGYKLDPKSPRIDPSILKSPDYERHHTYPAWNYRMNDVTAAEGLNWLRFSPESMSRATLAKLHRQQAATLYREALDGCEWVQAQYIPDGWQHDFWSFAIALRDKSLFQPFVDAIVKHGGERPFGCWRLTYTEPAFRHLVWEDADRVRWVEGAPKWEGCPVAEDLQPRLVQFQTNDLASAERNANALRRAIEEIDSKVMVTA
jgi:perosamine synthetase